MQRLFSTFPNDWPGCGLLLLRLTVAVPLLIESVMFICGMSHGSVLGIQLAALATAGLLVAGLSTPLASTMQILLESWMAWYEPGRLVEHIVLTVIGISLIMLGPGAWSVDARLFGRKRIDLGQE
jgi:uncharacterized membrane protein YphA (DoxX/SURF4 family)